MLVASAQAASFPDVAADADYAEAAEVLCNMGIMQGTTDGKFNPDSYVTRAQLAAILCRSCGETEGLSADGTLFSDVPESHWANAFIAKVASLGIISGYADGTFRPDNTVTYAQAITMVVRMVGLEDQAKEAGGYPNGYIKIASENGLSGRLEVNQGDLMTRWQIAKNILGIFS